ncbi:MAG: hypothetical protein KF902_01790 [Phycisphaeraceae bacterium]|nr:hypothetical protein [Phycisphaeraceae bacterium]MCW5769030.1 hypothetical protein [Phycisphaeraceae bacterium]
MRQLLVFAASAAMLVLLATIAIALMISIAGDRTSWWLVGVFAVDSVLLVLLAGRGILIRNSPNAGNGNAMPH